MKRHAIWILLLLAPCLGSSGFTEAVEPDPAADAPQIIVWVDGRWNSVSMLENRDGTIIYQKEDDANPVAAKEYSVNVPVTVEVNGALRAFYLSCHGHDVALEEIFDLSGESRSLFETIAVRLSRGCYERLKTRYRSLREARQPEPMSREARLQDVARQLELQRDREVSLTNEDLDIAADSGGATVEHLTDAEIAIQCAEDWPNDPVGRSSCEDRKRRDRDAQRDRASTPSDLPPQTFEEIRTWCGRQSINNPVKQNQCEWNQARAYREIERRTAATEKVDAHAFAKIRETCRSKHPDDYAKQNSCERRALVSRELEKRER